MFKRKSTKTLAMCMYFWCAQKNITNQSKPKKQKKQKHLKFWKFQNLAHAKNKCSRIIYVRVVLFVGVLSLSETYTMFQRKNTKTIAMCMFSWCPTSKVGKTNTIDKPKFFFPKIIIYIWLLRICVCKIHIFEFLQFSDFFIIFLYFMCLIVVHQKYIQITKTMKTQNNQKNTSKTKYI